MAAGFTQGRSVRILTVVREVELVWRREPRGIEASRARFADPIRGELRRPVNVVPQVTVGLDTTLIIVPTGNAPHSAGRCAGDERFARASDRHPQVANTCRVVDLTAGGGVYVERRWRADVGGVHRDRSGQSTRRPFRDRRRGAGQRLVVLAGRRGDSSAHPNASALLAGAHMRKWSTSRLRP